MTDLTLWREQVLSELYAIAADPTATMSDITESLGTIYHTAEAAGDERAMQLAIAVHERAQSLVAAADHAVGIAAAARQLAQELQQQRDALAQQHDELLTAARRGDYNHPVIGPAISDAHDDGYEAGQEAAHEELMYYGGFYTYDIAEDICCSGDIEIAEDDARAFHQYLTGGLNCRHHAAAGLRAELAEFITQFVQKCREHDL